MSSIKNRFFTLIFTLSTCLTACSNGVSEESFAKKTQSLEDSPYTHAIVEWEGTTKSLVKDYENTINYSGSFNLVHGEWVQNEDEEPNKMIRIYLYNAKTKDLKYLTGNLNPLNLGQLVETHYYINPLKLKAIYKTDASWDDGYKQKDSGNTVAYFDQYGNVVRTVHKSQHETSGPERRLNRYSYTCTALITYS